MFMNLGPLAKVKHGVNWRSTQSEQKAEFISSLDTVLRRAHIRGSQDALPSGHRAHQIPTSMWQQWAYLKREYEREVLKNQVHAYWSKTPRSAWKDMWLGCHTVTPNPDYEWHWVGQCRRNPTKWLGVSNEHLAEKSSSRSPFEHPYHETE